jgi:hypothetical protein
VSVLVKSETDAATFEKHERHLHVYYREMSALSKKRANDALNKFKLALINTTIRELNTIIGRPLEGFDLFDETLLPSNSDVSLVLAQYVAATFDFRVANTKAIRGKYYWVLNGKPLAETESPSKFVYRET